MPRGAKGGRKVETLNRSRRETNALNVHGTQLGEEQRKLRTHRLSKMAVGRLGNERHAWIEPEELHDLRRLILLWS
jgi:hypothetical protein